MEPRLTALGQVLTDDELAMYAGAADAPTCTVNITIDKHGEVTVEYVGACEDVEVK